jgi:competence ComEA-like helix-hairpin-helix protein
VKAIGETLYSFFTIIEDRFGRDLFSFVSGIGVGCVCCFFWLYLHRVPHEEIIFEPNQQHSQAVPAPTQAVIQTTPTLSPTISPKQEEDQKININSATQEELEKLPGIGPVTAAKIIQFRPYSSVFDIQRVPGIGKKKYEQLYELIST